MPGRGAETSTGVFESFAGLIVNRVALTSNFGNLTCGSMLDMTAKLSTIAVAIRMCVDISSAGDAAETLSRNLDGMPLDTTPTKYSPGP